MATEKEIQDEWDIEGTAHFLDASWTWNYEKIKLRVYIHSKDELRLLSMYS